MQPSMLLKLLRKLTVDVSKLSEYTTVALRVRWGLFDRFIVKLFILSFRILKINNRNKAALISVGNFIIALFSFLVINAALWSLREILRLYRLRWSRHIRRIKRRRETPHDGTLQQYFRFFIKDGLRSRAFRKSSAMPDGYRLRLAARLFFVEELWRRVVRQQVGLDPITWRTLQSATDQYVQVIIYFLLSKLLEILQFLIIAK